MSIITILTDFGYQDPYVGVMKGVISTINPEAKIIDISHDIPSFGIRHAAFSLFSYWKYFPEGTVHLVVVDPGVGSKRKAIALEVEKRYFVLPDNGIITYIWREGKNKRVYVLEDDRYFLKPVSNTFHGRDIFSPVSAYISKGVNLHLFGEKLDTPILFPFALPEVKGNEVYGEIIYADKFGNLVTNIHKSFFPEGFSRVCATIKGENICKLVKYYGEAQEGEKVLIFGSTEFLEVSATQENLAEILNIKIGEKIKLTFGK